MTDRENIPPRLTRAVVKRASAMEDSSCQPQSKKKRVALSDLHNLTNAVPSRGCSVQSKTNKARTKKKEQDSKRKEFSCKEIEVSNVSTSTAHTFDEIKDVEDPHMFAPYASDIYHYLRSMEVGSWF
jgi:cyclin-A